MKISASDHPHQYNRTAHPPWYLPDGFANRNNVRYVHPCNQARVSRALGPSPSGGNYCIFAGPAPRRSQATHRATHAQGRAFFLHVRGHGPEAAAVCNRCEGHGTRGSLCTGRESKEALCKVTCATPLLGCPRCAQELGSPESLLCSGILLGTCNIMVHALGEASQIQKKPLPLGSDCRTAPHTASLCPPGAVWSRAPDLCVFFPQICTAG